MKFNFPCYPAAKPMAIRDVNHITDLIIHHSAGPKTQTALDIDAEHRNIGMSMIGYNYVITPDGVVSHGRQENAVPAASFGRNYESLNICLIGNFEHGDSGYTGPPTAMQIQSLKELSVYAHVTFPSITRTIGHRDVATLFYPQNTADYATACPGDQLYALIPAVKAYTSQTLHSKL
jgi:N-acetylmuramoyl-L-alanine amidase